jgi:hypothetical protein
MLFVLIYYLLKLFVFGNSQPTAEVVKMYTRNVLSVARQPHPVVHTWDQGSVALRQTLVQKNVRRLCSES